MLAFSHWLAATSLSAAIDGALWLIPTVQTIHIISLALLFSTAAALALASYGHLARNVPLAQTARRFAPWVWATLALLLGTGVILIIGEPEREFINWAFWIKMPLIVIAAAATAFLLSQLGQSEAVGDVIARAKVKAPATAVLLLWCLVVIFGRLIAYGQITS